MPHTRNMTAVALTTVLVGACAAVASPTQAAVRTRATLTVSSTSPIAHETFTAAGRVSTHFRRPVVLRVSTGSDWAVVRRTRTSPAGAYRVTGLSTTATRRYSLLVPAARHAGRRFSQVVSRARTVRSIGQGGTIDVLPPVAAPGRSPDTSTAAANVVSAHFSPARPGRVVVFSRELADGGWVTAGTDRQGVDGTASFRGATRSGSYAFPFRATTVAQHGAPAVTSAAAVDTWVATFDDEFSGPALDRSKWSYRLGTAPSRTRSTNDAGMVSLADGTMHLSVALDPAYANATAATSHYLNAQVASQGSFDFTYGVASARIKFAPQLGQHGSFWLQSPTYDAFPGDPARSGAEVGTVEYFGQGYPRGGLAAFLYYQDPYRTNVKIGAVQPRAASLLPAGDTFANSYHVYTVRWTSSGYTFYIDGRVLYTSTQAVSQTGEYLILSLLTSDWELAHLPRAALPTVMSVDWAKVWQSA